MTTPEGRPFEEGREKENTWEVATIMLQGLREEMQDAAGHATVERGDAKCLAVFVCDGHGHQGHKAADEAVRHFFDALPGLGKEDKHAWLNKELTNIQNHLEQVLENKAMDGGTTATAMLLEDKHCVIAYVGDSEAAIVNDDGTITSITIPHQYEAHEEDKKRLDAMDALIVEGYVGTKGGYLAMSRSLGDKSCEPEVTHEPEFVEHDAASNEKFLIVASDGLWNRLEDEQLTMAEEALRAATSAADAAARLKTLLLGWELHDNVTVKIVALKK